MQGFSNFLGLFQVIMANPVSCFDNCSTTKPTLTIWSLPNEPSSLWFCDAKRHQHHQHCLKWISKETSRQLLVKFVKKFNPISFLWKKHSIFCLLLILGLSQMMLLLNLACWFKHHNLLLTADAEAAALNISPYDMLPEELESIQPHQAANFCGKKRSFISVVVEIQESNEMKITMDFHHMFFLLIKIIRIMDFSTGTTQQHGSHLGMVRCLSLQVALITLEEPRLLRLRWGLPRLMGKRPVSLYKIMTQKYPHNITQNLKISWKFVEKRWYTRWVWILILCFCWKKSFLHHPRFSGQNRAAEMKAQKRSLEQKVMVPRISSRQLCEVKRSDQSLPFFAPVVCEFCQSQTPPTFHRKRASVFRQWLGRVSTMMIHENPESRNGLHPYRMKALLRSMLLEDDYAEPARVRGACPQDVIVLDFFTNIFFVVQQDTATKATKGQAISLQVPKMSPFQSQFWVDDLEPFRKVGYVIVP